MKLSAKPRHRQPRRRGRVHARVDCQWYRAGIGPESPAGASAVSSTFPGAAMGGAPAAPFAYRLLEADHRQHERAHQEGLSPSREAQRSRAEEDVHERQVDKAKLEDEDRPYAGVDPAVREKAYLERRAAQRAAFQEVEDLEQDHGRHRRRLGLGEIAARGAEVPEDEDPHGPGGHQEADQDGPEEDEPVQDLAFRVERRPAHYVGLLGLEGQGEAEGDRGDQVDPEYLHGRYGQERLTRGGHREERHGEQDDQGLPQVRRKEERQGFADVVVDPAALLHGRRDRGEVVVGEDDVRRLLGDVGAGYPHRDSYVRLLEGGGVVDAVAGHRRDLAVLLQGAHEVYLVLGGDAGEDVCVGGDLPQHLFGEPVELAPGYSAVRLFLADQPDLATYGGGGAGVVARDHLDGYTRVVARGDRVYGLLARWIGHPREPEQLELILRVGLPDRVHPRSRLQRERQHAQPTGGHALHHVYHRLPTERLATSQRLAPLQDDHRGTLQVYAALSGCPVVGRIVERGHKLLLGLERDRVHAAEAAAGLGGVEAQLLRGHDERALGRVADDGASALAVVHRSVVAQEPGERQLLDGFRRSADRVSVPVHELSFGVVARAA